MSQLPEKFRETMREQLGSEYPAFLESLQKPSSLTVRLNPLKTDLTAITEQVPWCRSGQYLQQRPVFTLDPLFHAGAYYVQEASSMFLEQALKQAVDLHQPLNILDLCAAPGGKSTHILSLISGDSLLVSNEVIRSRASILSENIQKWGYPNAVVSNNDPLDFKKLPGFFDVIVVDAPCSGEGLFRKEPDAMKEWSPENVQLCSGRQKRILADIWDALRQNGILIYCTCTYNQLENEENLKWIRENYNVEFLALETDPAWCIEEVGGADEFKGYHFYPHRVRGEGFFLSVIKKLDGEKTHQLKTRKTIGTPSKKISGQLNDWIECPEESTFFQFKDLVFFTPSARAQELELLQQQLRIVYAGTNVAAVKHDKLVPEHPLALSIKLRAGHFPKAELNAEQALRYLRRETIQLPDSGVGFSLVTYLHQPLGWVNVLSGRVNNMYPTDWRIRMRD